MTDAELIELLRNTAADDLDIEQIEFLRQRMSESPELRQTFSRQLALQSNVAAALARIQVSADDLAGTAQRFGGLHPFEAIVAVPLSLAACAALALALFNAIVLPRVSPNDRATSMSGLADAAEPDDAADGSTKSAATGDGSSGTSTGSSTGASTGAAANSNAGDSSPGDPRSAEPDPAISQDAIDQSDSTGAEAADATVRTEVVAPRVKIVGMPWEKVMRNEGELPAFGDLCFRSDEGRPVPSRDDLEKWFVSVPGEPHRFREQSGLPTIDGLVKLVSPWSEDSSLRLSLTHFSRMKMHFYRGDEGLTLLYRDERASLGWTAYATRRSPQAARPSSFRLVASDEDRSRRTGLNRGGPFSLCHRNGELVLTRGDLVVLRAPLQGPITDVFWEGTASIRDIAIERTDDEPPVDEPRPLDTDLAASELDWTPTLAENAVFDRVEDEAVQLVSNDGKTISRAVARLPRSGIQEVLLEIDQATQGSGVFLGSSAAEPTAVLRFCRNERTGTTWLGVQRGPTWRVARNLPDAERIGITSGPVWLRMLFGCGTLRWWMSHDGVHWAEPELGTINLPAGATHLGLHCLAGVENCRIRLRRIQLRQLPGIASLVPGEVVRQTGDYPVGGNYPGWLADVTHSRPADVDENLWRRAAAIRSLGDGCSSQLGHTLLNLLLDEAHAQDVPHETQLAAFADAALLIDARNHATLMALLERYYRRAEDTFARDGTRPFSSIQHAILTLPTSTTIQFRTDHPPLIRVELLDLLNRGEWSEAIDFCHRLRFFHQHQQSPYIPWAETVAQRYLPRRPGVTRTANRQVDWEHPLVDELSKDAYNLLAELRAILDSDAFEDAGRMITSLEPETFTGVAPSNTDQNLLLSLPSAIVSAVRTYPELKSLMNDRYGDLARLRVRQAIKESNLGSVRLATVQFEGTEAAAEAHRWLGDRALSNGWFATAVAEYRRAEQTAGAALSFELASRVRLAAAMLGVESGERTTQPVTFGDVVMSPGEFESLVAEMLARSASTTSSHAVDEFDSRRTAPPIPSQFELRPAGMLDGPFGQSPQSEITPRVKQYFVDWVARQISVVQESETTYVSNRFHVAAFSANGERLWQSGVPEGKNPLRSQDWTLMSMRPLVVGDRIFARLMYGRSPSLAALSKENGELIWISPERNDEYIVSDPVMLQDRLAAVTIVRQSLSDDVLRLTFFDRETGDLLVQHDLARLAESWWRRRACRVTSLDDQLIASLGGVTLSCDSAGTVRWIRKHSVLPATLEYDWVRQHLERPLVHDNRVYVLEPGVRSLECLAPATGARIWSVFLPSLERIVGISGDRLIVQTTDSLRALHRITGKPLWQTSLPNLLNGQLCGDGDYAFISHRVPAAESANSFRVAISWLNAASGELRGTTELATTDDPDPRFGPVWSQQGRLFAFFGRGPTEPKRELVELAYVDPLSSVASLRDVDPWQAYLSAEVGAAAREVLGDWTLLGGRKVGDVLRTEEAAGEQNVLVLESLPEEQIVFTRRIDLAKDGKPRLRIRAGHPDAKPWRLRIQVGPETVWDGELTSKFPGQPWKNLVVNLDRFRGQSVAITVTGKGSTPTERITTWWKRLEVTEGKRKAG